VADKVIKFFDTKFKTIGPLKHEFFIQIICDKIYVIQTRAKIRLLVLFTELNICGSESWSASQIYCIYYKIHQ